MSFIISPSQQNRYPAPLLVTMKLSIAATIVIATITQASARRLRRNTGSKGCPCLNVRAVLLESESCEIEDVETFGEGKGVLTATGACVPVDYGSYCENFDCPSDQFCYVDPDNCDLDTNPSGYFPGLVYSFFTCDQASDSSSSE